MSWVSEDGCVAPLRSPNPMAGDNQAHPGPMQITPYSVWGLGHVFRCKDKERIYLFQEKRA